VNECKLSPWRKAERDASKRAPAKAGALDAVGAAEAAAALANFHNNLGGDWTTQTEDPMSLWEALRKKGAKNGYILKIKADDGNRQGLTLVHVRDHLEHIRDTFMG
jgi:hypothetical protein